MVQNLRPAQAARALGMGRSTFYRKAKGPAREPDFPPLIKLGPRMTVIRVADIEAYVERRAQKNPEEVPE